MEKQEKTINILLKDRVIDKSQGMYDVVLLVGVKEPLQVIDILNEESGDFGLVSIPFDNMDQELSFAIALREELAKIKTQTIKLLELKEKENASFKFGPISFNVEVFGFVDPDENGGNDGKYENDEDYESEILSKLNSISEPGSTTLADLNKEQDEINENNTDSIKGVKTEEDKLDQESDNGENICKSGEEEKVLNMDIDNSKDSQNLFSQEVNNDHNDMIGDTNNLVKEIGETKKEDIKELTTSEPSSPSYLDVPLGFTVTVDDVISDVKSEVQFPGEPSQTKDVQLPSNKVDELNNINGNDMNQQSPQQFNMNVGNNNLPVSLTPDCDIISSEPKVTEVPDGENEPVTSIPSDIIGNSIPVVDKVDNSYVVSELGSGSISASSINNYPSVETPGNIVDDNTKEPKDFNTSQTVTQNLTEIPQSDPVLNSNQQQFPLNQQEQLQTQPQGQNTYQTAQMQTQQIGQTIYPQQQNVNESYPVVAENNTVDINTNLSGGNVNVPTENNNMMNNNDSPSSQMNQKPYDNLNLTTGIYNAGYGSENNQNYSNQQATTADTVPQKYSPQSGTPSSASASMGTYNMQGSTSPMAGVTQASAPQYQYQYQYGAQQPPSTVGSYSYPSQGGASIPQNPQYPNGMNTYPQPIPFYYPPGQILPQQQQQQQYSIPSSNNYMPSYQMPVQPPQNTLPNMTVNTSNGIQNQGYSYPYPYSYPYQGQVYPSNIPQQNQNYYQQYQNSRYGYQK